MSLYHAKLRYRILKALTAAACAYETFAIVSDDRVPTISEICGTHAWLAPAVIGALAFHLYYHDISVSVRVRSKKRFGLIRLKSLPNNSGNPVGGLSVEMSKG